MRRMKVVVLIIVFLASLASVKVVFAIYYAGNSISSVYGGKATIGTPPTKPYMPSNGQLQSWVSLPSPNWIQTGWLLLPTWTSPQAYVKSLVNGNYSRSWYGNKNWGSYELYQISYDGASTWFAYIGGSSKGGVGPLYAPNVVQAYTEVQGTPTSVVSTLFANVYYRNSSGVWNLFNQANWVENTPYHVDKISNYYYRTYGP